MNSSRYFNNSNLFAFVSAAVMALPGMLVYTPLLIGFAQALCDNGLSMQVVDRDFANYWIAGRMALSGEYPDLFIQHIYFPHLQQQFGADYPIRNWGYPPHFLLLLWPLGLLSYKSAMMLFLAVTFALFVAAVVSFRRTYAPQSDWRILLLALAGYSLMMIDAAQNGFLFGAALLFGLVWMKQRPMLAGIAFAVLTIKPQLGILVPVLLLSARLWRTIGWTVLLTTLLVALSAVIFGVASWEQYLTETLSYQRSVMSEWQGVFLSMMPTIFGGVRALGYFADVAYSAQWPITVSAMIIIVYLLWKERRPLRAAFLLACGTFVISPYAFNYDMGALTAIAAVLAGSRTLKRSAAVALGLVAGLPAMVMTLGVSSFPIAPLVLAAGVLALALDDKPPLSAPVSSGAGAT